VSSILTSSTFSISEFSQWLGGQNPTLLLQNLREDVGEDSASAVVVYFHGGIDADYDGEIEG
jgi:hypothetical protein